jgi:REP element-mobilizing transposase RayT
MARKARIDAEGAVHHIIVRGIEGKTIFRREADRNNFLGRLDEIITESKTQCFAWVLMKNHVHLLLRTGVAPISKVMQRILTGYAVWFNKKYRRHGHLFQNRYKSILCEENIYLKELVRYIHLNPFRAGMVEDMNSLDEYKWSGHTVIMGKITREFHDVGYVLGLFADKESEARRKYRLFVKKGIDQGKRDDLTGGGLIRSTGGWEQVKMLRKSGIRLKGDERILGSSEFVLDVLKSSEERLKKKYELKTGKYDFEYVIKRVGKILGVKREDILGPGRRPEKTKARNLVCYFANRELGMTTVDISKRLNICQSAISRSVYKGEFLSKEHHYSLIDK